MLGIMARFSAGTLSERVRWIWERARGPLAGLLLLAATAGYAALLDPTYAVADWLAWPILLLWGYNLALFAAFLGAGHLLIRRVLRLELPAFDVVALSIPTGMVLFCLLMHALGALGLFNVWAAASLVLVLIAATVVPLVRYASASLAAYRQESASEGASPLTTLIRVLAVGYGVVCLGLMYLPLLTPDTLNYDSTWYHQTIAQDYAREGRIIPFIADYTRNLPQLTPLIHTWGYLMPVPGVLQRWTLPLHTEFFVVLSTLVGIAAVIRYLAAPTRPRFAWVGFFLFPSIFVYDLNIGGAADHFLALFCPALFLVAARIQGRNELSAWLLFGWLVGGATLAKYQSVYLVLAVSPLLAAPLAGHTWGSLRAKLPLRWRGPDGPPPEAPWKPFFVYPLFGIAVAVVVVAPHFVRNLVFYGNPMYPMAQEFFGGKPTVPDAARQVDLYMKDWNFRPHGPFTQQLVESLRLMFTFSLEPHYSFTKQWPNFGSLFTLTLPLVLFVKRRGRVVMAYAVSLLAIFAWASTYRVDRNLQAVVPIIAAATTALLIRLWELGALARVGTVGLVGLQIAWGGDALFYSQEPRLLSAIRLITSGYKGKVDTRNDFREAYQQIDKAVPDDAKLVMHPHPVCLGINKTMLGDLPGHQGLITYAGLGGATAMKDYYESLGVTHVIDQVGAPASSKRDELLFLEFMRSGRARRFGHLSLLAVADTHPRPDPPSYEVFLMGIPHYRDGLYDLQQLSAFEYVPPSIVEFATPEVEMPADAEQRNALLAEATAALLAPLAPLTAEEQSTLRQLFKLGRQHRTFHVYLRR